MRQNRTLNVARNPAPRGRLALLAALTMVALGACGGQPTAGPGTGPRPSGAAGQQPSPTRVVVAIGAELNNLATKLEGGNTYASDFNFMSNSPLVVMDPQGRASPLLAVEQPSRDNGTWVVNPDGTMTTTWKIRPNAKWHDGQPVVSSDFAFALRVTMDEAMPVRSREPERFMDRVEPVDDKTFVINWKQPYPWANQLLISMLEPLPEHIMGSVYAAGDVDAFLNNPFWSTTAYVGEGPYVLTEWDPGAQLQYHAFPDYFMGKPKIDEIIFRIIPDTNTVVANVLGGSVDATVGITLGQSAGVTVKNQWATTGDGQVIVTPVRFRYVQIQLDPNRTGQPALLDARVRQAIVHGIDRVALAEIVTQGTSPATEVPVAPSDPLYPAVDRVIAKHPYDQNRALSLLQDAGWTKRGDTLVDGSGQAFNLEIRTTAGADNEAEANIMGSDLTKLGLQATQNVIAQSRIRDLEYRVTFPGLNTTAMSIDIPGIFVIATSDQCASSERRFIGSNRGCWKNAEFDRLYTVASTSLDPAEREGAVAGALKILTEDVGIFGTSYNSENIAVKKGLVGPGARWPAQIGNTWDVYNWTWS